MRTIALVLIVFGAASSTRSAEAQPRIALVIGNGGYENAALANPVNDARLMAETLRGLGFDVIERSDADQKEMKLAIFELGDRLETAGKDAVGLFYYAGHGVQVNGENYLIPLHAQIERERHVAIEAVGASWVLGQMEFAGNRVNFVILDACRNNPLTRGFRSQLRGLARMDAPTGSLIAYSTGPGGVAVDGERANSPYTLALSQVMRTPNVPAEKVFKLVRNAVREETRGKQTPWEESSLTGADFYFNTSASVTVEAPEASALNDSAAVAQREIVLWQSIEKSTDPAMFDAYLQQFPNGTFAGVARLKREALREAASRVQSTASVEGEADEARRLEEQRQARYRELVAQAALAFEKFEKPAAQSKYREALTLVPDGQEARVGLARIQDPCFDIIGEWRWFNGGIASFFPNNTFSKSDSGNTGRWECIDASRRKFRLSWRDGGWVDTVQLSRDGLRLSGSNQFFFPVSGVRPAKGGSQTDKRTGREN